MTSILSSATGSDVVTDPFPHILIENALPASYYAQLAGEYPSFESVAGTGPHENNTLFLRSAYELAKMPDLAPVWREFIAYHMSRDFYLEVVALFGAHIRKAHPALEQTLGRELEDFTIGWRPPSKSQDPDAASDDAKLDVQLGFNSPVTEKSSVRTAHVDSKFKLFAGLLYVRDQADSSTGGDLELCHFNPADAKFDRRQNLLGRNFEVRRIVRYRPNTLVLWVNSPAALHGVSPRDATEIPRRYVNFLCETYKQPGGLFSLPGP
jgi:hypothetical protein